MYSVAVGRGRTRTQHKPAQCRLKFALYPIPTMRCHTPEPRIALHSVTARQEIVSESSPCRAHYQDRLVVRERGDGIGAQAYMMILHLCNDSEDVNDNQIC